jgi:hypothetical protein
VTPHEADAATLRGIGERMQSRGDEGVAALTFFVATLVEDCTPVPLDLVIDIVDEINTGKS